MPQLSIVIPTLNEKESLPHLLADLAAVRIDKEIVVADGGSTDGTASDAERAGAKVIHTARGRGIQLAAGADEAQAPLLCFLHADASLSETAVAELTALAEDRPVGAFAFRLRIPVPGLIYRIIESGAAMRSRVFQLPYGDQGLVVRRTDYERAGGYPPWPLMEDVALVRSLARFTRVRLLSSSVVVSPRRWQRDGPIRRSVANQLLLARYMAGASPSALAASYENGASRGG